MTNILERLNRHRDLFVSDDEWRTWQCLPPCWGYRFLAPHHLRWYLAESGNLEEIKRLTEGGENVNHTIGFELSGR